MAVLGEVFKNLEWKDQNLRSMENTHCIKTEKYQMDGRRQLLYPSIKVKVVKSVKIIVISLLSVSGKVYGRVQTERLMEVTEVKVNEE